MRAAEAVASHHIEADTSVLIYLGVLTTGDDPEPPLEEMGSRHSPRGRKIKKQRSQREIHVFDSGGGRAAGPVVRVTIANSHCRPSPVSECAEVLATKRTGPVNARSELTSNRRPLAAGGMLTARRAKLTAQTFPLLAANV